MEIEKKEIPDSKPTGPLPHPKKLKILTTIAILFGNITFGCAFNFYSPALEDLKTKYMVKVDEVSKVFTVMLVSYCVGALTAGIVYNFINRQLGVIACLGGMAIGLYATPHCDTITIFFVIGGFLGFFIGAYDVSQVVWIIEIWQEKSGPLIQLQHFCYAVGSNIPPLILGPFLLEKGDDDDDDSNISTTTRYSDEESKIYVPFTIGGSLSAAAFGFQVFLFIFYRYYVPPMYSKQESESIGEIYVDKHDDVNNNDDDKSKNQNTKEIVESECQTEPADANAKMTKESIMTFISSPKFKLILITGMFLGSYQGMEMCTLQFIPTFAHNSDLQLSKSDSAYVLTGLTGAFAVGRLFGIFIIMKFSPVLMLLVHLSLVIAGNVILLVWGNSNLTMLWVGCITMGAGFSTIFGSFSAFMERNLVFSDAIGSFMIVCGSGLAAIYPLIVGEWVEDNVVVLTYTNFVSLILCSVALSLGLLLTRGNKVRH